MESLRTLHWQWVLPILLAKSLLIVLKYHRWKVILRSSFHRTLRGVFSATTIGYFTNMMIPMRLGEILRAGVVSRKNREVRTPDVLGTIAAERLIDLAVLVLLASLVSPWMAIPSSMRRGALLLFGLLGIVVLVSLLEPLHESVAALLPSNVMGRGLAVLLRAMSRGTAILRSPSGLALATFWTVIIWLVDSSALYFATRTTDAGIGYLQSIFIMLLFALGLTIPSAPAQLGTHQALAVFLLTPLGATTAQAVATSLVLQSSNLIVLSIFGGSASFREISRWRQNEDYDALPTAKISADKSGNS